MNKLPCALAFGLFALGRAAAQPPQQQALTELVHSFEEARHDFDLLTITRLVASDYVEVSPLGEVDPRDRMLGFYVPAKKVPAPPMALSELAVRSFGDSAAVLGKLTYTVPGHPLELRVTYLAHREVSGWKLVSVQYTGIHAAH